MHTAVVSADHPGISDRDGLVKWSCTLFCHSASTWRSLLGETGLVSSHGNMVGEQIPCPAVSLWCTGGFGRGWTDQMACTTKLRSRMFTIWMLIGEASVAPIAVLIGAATLKMSFLSPTQGLKT